MKRSNHRLILVVLLASLVCFTACGSQSQSSSPSDTEPTSQDVVSEESPETDDAAETDSSETDAGTTDSAEPEAVETVAGELGGTEYDITALNGTLRIPDGYYLLDDDHPFTDQMCEDVSIDPSNLASAMPLLQGQTLVIPSDKPYAESNQIYIKVKAKKYGDTTLSELSESEYNTLASTVVSSFGVSDYETVEGNGLRYFVFNADQGLGNVCRYATILNGHMVYIYEKTGESLITDEERSVLEFIALSVRHGL